jgi:hypothetical protein
MNYKLPIIILLSIMLISSIGLFVFNKNKINSIKNLPKITPTTSPIITPVIKDQVQIDLYLDPEITSAKVGDEVNFSVRINSNNLLLIAAETYFSYNPKVLTIDAIQPGTIFSSPNILLNKIDSQLGKISYAIGTFQPIASNGLLFRISGKIKSLPINNTIDLTFDQTNTKIGLESPNNSKLYSADEIINLYHETQMSVIN